MTKKEEKIDLLERAFTTYVNKYGGKICPECHLGLLEIDPAIRYLMHYNIADNGNLSPIPADGDSVVMVFCRHCGYTKLLLVDCGITRNCKEIDTSITKKIIDANVENED